MIRRELTILVLSLLVLFVACIQQTPIDIEKTNKVGKIDSLIVRHAELEITAGRPRNTGDSPLLLLGQADNKRASFLVKFDKLPDSSVVESAEFHLITFSSLGDTVGEIRATAHRVLQDWQESEVTFETFANQFDPQVIAEATIVPADTDTVVFNLDPQLVTSWIDSTVENYGIYIKIEQGAFLKQFYSGNSVQNQPFLRVRYRRVGADTTLLAEFSPTADAFIFEETAPLPEGPLYVSDGDDYRTLLKFDLSSIPKYATINRAQLYLTIDSTRTFLSESDGHVFDIYRLTEASANPINAPLDSANAVNSTGGVALSSTRTLGLDITEQVQNWTFGLHDNFGMLLTSRRPERELYRVAFYSTKTDSTKAPYIKVYFTVPSDVQSGE